jgi:hypothetical protein
MKKYYRTYNLRPNSEINSDLDLFSELSGGINGTGEIDGVPINQILRINIPIFLTQNIEDLGIYEDIGKTEFELNSK